MSGPGTFGSRVWPLLLFHPSRRPIACQKTERLSRSDAGRVQLWGEGVPDAVNGRTGSPELVVLRFLGARGRAELSTRDPADRLSSVRSEVWTVNPPGFGASEGPLTIERWLAQAVHAFDFLGDLYPNARLWVYGKSIGACAALAVAAARQPGGVVLKNVLPVADVVERRARRWACAAFAARLRKLAPTGLDVAAHASAARAPALFVISSADRLALRELQEAVRERYGGPSEALFVRGGHDDARLDAADEAPYRRAIESLWVKSLGL